MVLLLKRLNSLVVACGRSPQHDASAQHDRRYHHQLELVLRAMAMVVPAMAMAVVGLRMVQQTMMQLSDRFRPESPQGCWVFSGASTLVLRQLPVAASWSLALKQPLRTVSLLHLPP